MSLWYIVLYSDTLHHRYPEMLLSFPRTLLSDFFLVFLLSCLLHHLRWLSSLLCLKFLVQQYRSISSRTVTACNGRLNIQIFHNLTIVKVFVLVVLWAEKRVFLSNTHNTHFHTPRPQLSEAVSKQRPKIWCPDIFWSPVVTSHLSPVFPRHH